MTYRLIIDPFAKTDIRQCIDWYDMQQSGLGDRFLDAVFEILDFIENNPNSFQIKYRDTRIAPVKNFPMMVHYTIDKENKTIPVLAVLHASRNPNIWNERK